jgi:phosphoribosylformimino-5-aminoimidazole carboxamide ribotide isomerase
VRGLTAPVELYPAIDLRGGRCVRLYQGDYGRETVYADDPVAQARTFAGAGAHWIHVVDLDAARTGEAVNRPVIVAIAGAVGPTVAVQVGGGVRDDRSADELLGAGVTRVVLGTAAVEDPALVARLAARHPGGIAVGLDGRRGEVAVRGWTEQSGIAVVDAARRFGDVGVAALIVTEIARDGTLEGPDLDGLAAVLAAAPASVDVIASGGVGTVAHLRALAALDAGGRRLGGAIVGRALYDGAFTLADGLAAVGTV